MFRLEVLALKELEVKGLMSQSTEAEKVSLQKRRLEYLNMNVSIF